jgi:hypothetical protein
VTEQPKDNAINDEDVQETLSIFHRRHGCDRGCHRQYVYPSLSFTLLLFFLLRFFYFLPIFIFLDSRELCSLFLFHAIIGSHSQMQTSLAWIAPTTHVLVQLSRPSHGVLGGLSDTALLHSPF